MTVPVRSDILLAVNSRQPHQQRRELGSASTVNGGILSLSKDSHGFLNVVYMNPSTNTRDSQSIE